MREEVVIPNGGEKRNVLIVSVVLSVTVNLRVLSIASEAIWRPAPSGLGGGVDRQRGS